MMQNIKSNSQISTSSENNENTSSSDNFSEPNEQNIILANTDTLLDEEYPNPSAIYNFAPSENQTPISLLKDENVEYLSFPTIFCGKQRTLNSERYTPVQYSEICNLLIGDVQCQYQIYF